MCITKKATKKGADGTGIEKKKHVLWKKKSSAPSKEDAEKPVPSSQAPGQATSQLEKPSSGRADASQEKSGDTKKEPEVVNEEKQQQQPQKPTLKRPSAEARDQNSRSLNRPGGANQKKKGNKFRCGQVDRDELSITNDNTEFLENAQLTKLMSHADLKALMNGQLAQGGDIEGGDGCWETIEEVDSEMQDLVFSPLLAVIPKEEHRGFNTLANPNEA